MQAPLICVAILAKQKATILPSWLDSLSQWDYPKDRIALYVRANNSTDNTNAILTDWISANGDKYHSVKMDLSNLPIDIEKYGVHEWNATRFKALAKIRTESIDYALTINARFYVVVDVDNFLRPHIIRKLVSMNLPVVAPFLKYAPAVGEEDHGMYSNYHNIATDNGYYLDNPMYHAIWHQQVRGHIICDVVHCSYVIRQDVLPYVKYWDNTDDYEYVIFSRSLRKDGIPQYLDNTEVGGYLTLWENVEAVNKAMGELNGI